MTIFEAILVALIAAMPGAIAGIAALRKVSHEEKKASSDAAATITDAAQDALELSSQSFRIRIEELERQNKESLRIIGGLNVQVGELHRTAIEQAKRISQLDLENARMRVENADSDKKISMLQQRLDEVVAALRAAGGRMPDWASQ